MRISALFLTTSLVALAPMTIPATPASAETATIPSLEGKVAIRRDAEGIPHLMAHGARDLMVAQGWQHAADRLFQMDVLRRQASGMLAELFGSQALAQDVEIRTIGLRRAAERSLGTITDETRQAMEAYAEGVNAYVAAHPLPPEYGLLEITSVEPWTPVDSLAIAKLVSFSLSFDLDIAPTIAFQTYLAAGAYGGFDGAALYFEDTHRSAPFDPAATVPDALVDPAAAAVPAIFAEAGAGVEEAGAPPPAGPVGDGVPGRALGLAKNYLDRLQDLPVFQDAISPHRYDRGSNSWVVAGWRTFEGQPLLASDPHLSLTTPATFYPIHLLAQPDGYDVVGDSLPGTPFVLLGQNKDLAWGATTNRMDVTDTYLEQIVPDGTSPSGLSTVHDGQPEWLIPIPQSFCYNLLDGTANNGTCATPGSTVDGVAIPPVTLISPRRNNGPVVDIDVAAGTALTIQYTGFSGTREADYFRLLNEAETIGDVAEALRYMDVGAQNFMVAAANGDIAYFTNAEVPLREDLQAGIPGYPFFIRDGTGGQEWLVEASPPEDRATPYQIVPFEEMPQVVNPPSGVISNGNNDPLGLTLDNNPLNQLRPGGGLFYLAPRWSFGTRAGRIRDLLAERLADGGMIDFAGMQEIQADVTMLDAQVFVPHILDSFANAGLAGADPALLGLAIAPGVAKAVGRLEAWDGSAPTGIPEGFDAADVDGVLDAPDAAEVANSVAATIYAVWRGRIVANTVDAVLDPFGLPPLEDELAMTALRYLFDSFDANEGIGASGLSFFNIPAGADPATRRDATVLVSLQQALDALAGDDYADAFAHSTDQDDYRWGLLHRLTLAHPLGDPFSVPPAFGAFPDPIPELPGLSVDGGFGTVDASTHALRADNAHAFTFADGPVRRYVGEIASGGAAFYAESSLPGGPSGVPGSPLQVNLLGRWLTNDTYLVRQAKKDIALGGMGIAVLEP